jgi:lipopolysaccharide biosynthesis glycosyltransferase
VVSIAIACASDSRYAMPLAVMLRSLSTNLGPDCQVEVYAVDDAIDSSAKTMVLASLSDRMKLHWIEPNGSGLSNLPTWGRMPITTYQKLTLGEWLPSHIEKVIWLDCDMLVLDDLRPLWEADLEDWHLLAVPDQRVPLVSSRFGVCAYRDLGLKPETTYFNAGVLVIDVARWRQDDVAGHAIKYLNTYRDQVFFWDQEALNAVLARKAGKLDLGWNQNPTLSHLVNGHTSSDKDTNPPSHGGIRIAHFSGNLKPWNCAGQTPYHDLYFHYLDQTAWKGWRPPRTWRGTALEAYESSRLRRFLYPAEQWATQLVRTFTRN